MHFKMKHLYQAYEMGLMDRRAFVKKLSLLTGGAAFAYTALPLLGDVTVDAQIISENDTRLATENTVYKGETGEIRAYLARPKGKEKLPGVIVIHENRGLNAHIKDVTRRMALEGFLSLAPDALSPLGGTPDDSNKARSLLRELDRDATVKNFVAAVEYLKTHPLSTGNVGCTGFCWGGGITNQVAVHSPDLKAAVPYYGRQPETDEVHKIKASMLMHYAGLDERINSGIPAFEEALKAASIDYQIFVYEGAAHAFNNDTNESRYHEKAAKLAWERTIAFFKEKLTTMTAK